MKQDFLDIFQKIAPDLMETVKERYLLLRHISDAEPVGRRSLAGLSGLSERVVRAHVDVLRRSGIVRFTTLGISMQPEGRELMPDLLECFLRLNRLDEMQRTIQQSFHLKQVCIVPGDCDHDKTAKEELGRQGALLLSELLANGRTIVVSGGSTMAAVARKLPECSAAVTVVPARGGMGDQVEHQANVIAANIAAKTGGTYHMLHIPDGLTEKALHVLMQTEPQTREIMAMARKAQVVLFGIGLSETMARKRGLTLSEQRDLQQKGAVGEALGFYCSPTGEVVRAATNVGISLKDISRYPHVIAVAGGSSKAAAIAAVLRASRTGVLVTDEGAAAEIEKMI